MGSPDHNDMKREVLEGLSARQKQLSCKYFYDAYGSYLFEQICLQPEYYQTRTELSILRQAAPVVMADLEPDTLIEFGPGSIQKARVLLDALYRPGRGIAYVPVDVCEAVLSSAAADLASLYPEMEVSPVVSDFTNDCEMPPAKGRRLIVFLGSTIGNLSGTGALLFLKRIARLMGPQDRFLLGADMVKAKEVLEAAYNDRQGVTAEFNRNILNHLNRELGAHFDLSLFDHHAFYNENHRQVEMYLVANQDMEVMIDALGMTVTMARGETIFTETCRKYTKEDIEGMAAAAGLTSNRWFSDPQGWFSLVELALPGNGER